MATSSITAPPSTPLRPTPPSARTLPTCCDTHTGAHLHGCAIPTDHRGPCLLAHGVSRQPTNSFPAVTSPAGAALEGAVTK